MQQAEGAGGGMFNDGGIVRFEDAATFSENAALVSAERAKERALYILKNDAHRNTREDRACFLETPAGT